MFSYPQPCNTGQTKQTTQQSSSGSGGTNGNVLMVFAKELSATILNQSAAAAIAAAKGHGRGGDKVSVVGMEESVAYDIGGPWESRSSTPLFYRTPSPNKPYRHLKSPSPPRAPTPPDDVPSIYLEGPMLSEGSQVMVSDAQIELEGWDEEMEEDDYESMSVPVVLSGKVTLSVISSSGLCGDDDTEAPSSLSWKDDYVKSGDWKSSLVCATRILLYGVCSVLIITNVLTNCVRFHFQWTIS